MLNDTDRKFPRSMNEAFQNTVEYGAAIEIQVKQFNLVDKVMIAVSIVAFAVVILDLFVWGVK